MCRNLYKSAPNKTHNQKDLLFIDIQKHKVSQIWDVLKYYKIYLVIRRIMSKLSRTNHRKGEVQGVKKVYH